MQSWKMWEINKYWTLTPRCFVCLQGQAAAVPQALLDINNLKTGPSDRESLHSPAAHLDTCKGVNIMWTHSCLQTHTGTVVLFRQRSLPKVICHQEHCSWWQIIAIGFWTGTCVGMTVGHIMCLYECQLSLFLGLSACEKEVKAVKGRWGGKKRENPN